MFALLVIPPILAIILLNLPAKILKKLAFPLAALLLIMQIVLAVKPAWADSLLAKSVAARLQPFQFLADNLTMVMLLTIAIVGLVSLSVCRKLIADESRRFNFINLLLLATIGMNGVVMVSDLFSLYVFLEITAVSSFILIVFHREREAFEGSFKYLLLSAIATVMLLSALAFILLFAGGTSFVAVAAALQKSAGHPLLLLAMTMFVGGLLIKGGLVPFHGWLPDAYSSAPAPVSVLLAGIVTKTTGIYTLLRVVMNVFGFTPALQNILLFVGALSIVVGALAALGQSDFKRMLAYSSISQVGYIVLSFGTGTALGLAGAIFHLFNHSIFKALLFINATAVEAQTGLRDMNKMGGLSDRMPITGITSLIGFLSTAGVPPLSGFFSKLVIILALWQAHFYGYAVIATLASILTLAYFLLLQRRVFFGKSVTPDFDDVKEASLWVIVPAVVLALITIGVGICVPFVMDTIILPVKNFLW